jgi:ligand-binding sensor domain-containing protein
MCTKQATDGSFYDEIFFFDNRYFDMISNKQFTYLLLLILLNFLISCKKENTTVTTPEFYFEKIPGPTDIFAQGPHDILLDNTGKLWAAFEDGVGVYNGSQWIIHRPFTKRPNNASSGNYVWSILQDSRGIIWAVIENYFEIYACRFNGSNWDTWKLPPFEIHNIIEMPDGEIWFPSKGGGIHIFNGNSFVTSNASVIVTMSAFLDRNQTLWLGSTRNRYYKYVRKWEFEEFNIFVEYGSNTVDVLQIEQKRDGKLMFSLNPGGAKFLDGNSYKQMPSEGAVTGPVISTYEDSRNRTWIGTMSKGIILQEGNTIKEIPLSGQADWTNEFLEDKEGTIWISCAAGIFRYRKN